MWFTDLICVKQAQFLRSMWDLSSSAKDRTCIPCIAWRVPKNWMARKVPSILTLMSKNNSLSSYPQNINIDIYTCTLIIHLISLRNNFQVNLSSFQSNTATANMRWFGQGSYCCPRKMIFYLIVSFFYTWKMGLIILALYIPHRNVAKINEIRVKSYKPDKLRENHHYSIGFFK